MRTTYPKEDMRIFITLTSLSFISFMMVFFIVIGVYDYAHLPTREQLAITGIFFLMAFATVLSIAIARRFKHALHYCDDESIPNIMQSASFLSILMILVGAVIFLMSSYGDSFYWYITSSLSLLSGLYAKKIENRIESVYINR